MGLYLFDTKTMGWYFIGNYTSGLELNKLRPWDDGYEHALADDYEEESTIDESCLVFKSDTVDGFLAGAKIGGKPIAQVMTWSVIPYS